MSLTMTPAEREAFLAEVHVAVVTVADDDGRGPLAIPLWYDYQPGGEIILVTDGNSRKTQLIRKAGRVTVCAQTQELPLGVFQKLRILEVSDNSYPITFGDVPGLNEAYIASDLIFSHSTPAVSTAAACLARHGRIMNSG